MLTDPGVDGGAANSGSERLSGAFSVGDRDGWPTAIVGLMCLRKACQHGKAHQACRLRPIVAQKSCLSTFYSHMPQNVELAARPIEVEFDQRPLYRRQISFGERPGEAFLLPVMTYHGHLSPPQLPTPILSRIGVEVVRRRSPRGLTLCEPFFGRTSDFARNLRERPRSSCASAS